MLASSKITKKNQTTLPRVVLAALGLKPMDRLVYEIDDRTVTLRAKTENLAELKDRFVHFGKRRRYPVSVEEMHDSVVRGVAEKRALYAQRRRKTKKS